MGGGNGRADGKVNGCGGEACSGGGCGLTGCVSGSNELACRSVLEEVCSAIEVVLDMFFTEKRVP